MLTAERTVTVTVKEATAIESVETLINLDFRPEIIPASGTFTTNRLLPMNSCFFIGYALNNP